MSFKIFFLRTFKGLTNTQKVEQQYDKLAEEFRMYDEVRNSEEVQQFLALEKKVKSDEFRNRKKEVESLQFKGSPEEKLLQEFEKLKAKSKIHRMAAFVDSELFTKWQNINTTSGYSRFEELLAYVRGGEFEKDKNAFLKKNPDQEFEKTDSYQKYIDFEKLKEKFNGFDQFILSDDFEFWRKNEGAEDWRRFLDLKALMESAKYAERKAYLEDDYRWEKTDDFKELQQYEALMAQEQWKIFVNNRKASNFGFFEQWKLVFEDHFEQDQLNTEYWKTTTYAGEQLGRNFSLTGDLHAFTDGDNIKTQNSTLCIEVKPEQTQSLRWEYPGGLIPQEFNYSSGIIRSEQLFEVKEGILEAKIKYGSLKQLEHVFYLTNPENSFRVNLLECGKVNRFSLQDGQKKLAQSLSGLPSGQFYIFRLEWGNGKLRWKINDQEIFAAEYKLEEQPFNLNICSLVTDSWQGSTQQFEIDWVRVFEKR